MELFQIWLNLPARKKMVEPHFAMLWADTIPRFKQKDAAGKLSEIEVIAGKLDKYSAPKPPPDSWAADPKNEVGIWNIQMEPGAVYTLPKASPGINRSVYYYIGSGLKINNQEIATYHSLRANPEVDLKFVNGNSEGRVLVLQGKPIGEPVIQYGPFVMNTKEEIHQAFEDYHKTQFGGWPWPKAAQVHERNQGRFALHADGRKEVKG